MKKNKWVLKIGLGTIVVLFLIGFFGVRWLNSQFHIARVVKEIEAVTQARVQIESLDINLDTTLVKVNLKNLILVARDDQMEVDYEKRKPLELSAAVVRLHEAELTVQFRELANQHLWIESLKLKGLTVRDRRVSKEETLVQQITKSPQTKTQTTSAPEVVVVKDTRPKKFTLMQGALSAVDYILEDGETRISIVTPKDLREMILKININEEKVEQPEWNRVEIEAPWNVKVMRGDQKWVDAEMSFKADLSPLDTMTREENPRGLLSLNFEKSSWLGGQKTLGDVAEKYTTKLKRYNVDLSQLALGGELQEKAAIELRLENKRLTLVRSVDFIFPDYSFGLMQDDWVDQGDQQLGLRVKMAAQQRLQQQVIQGLKTSDINPDLLGVILNALQDDQGRLHLLIKVSGSQDKPEVRPELDVIYKNLLQGDQLKNLLRGLFKKKE
jgi:hypothetical protein